MDALSVEAERSCEFLGVLAAQMRQKYASIITQHIIDFTSLYMGQCTFLFVSL